MKRSVELVGLGCRHEPACVDAVLVLLMAPVLVVHDACISRPYLLVQLEESFEVPSLFALYCVARVSIPINDVNISSTSWHACASSLTTYPSKSTLANVVSKHSHA